MTTPASSIWDTIKFARADVRRALLSIRDGVPLAPDLRSRILAAIARTIQREPTQDELPQLANGILENRHNVAAVVCALNEGRPRGVHPADSAGSPEAIEVRP
ncbi:MAG TPA: hypothetical protein VM165_09010 [Planctomycetaceae bacterium]|nr:hypothetical protein [Planctomycetaceae bacterium]